MSQSKSDDNWVQEALSVSSKQFNLSREEAREIKKLKRKGLKEFADGYYDYLQLVKKEGGPLNFTLKEFCKKKGVKYSFTK